MNGLSRIRIAYYVLILLSAPVLIYFFGVEQMRFFKVPSGSMEPTLYPGDYLLTLAKSQYERGDIVVLEDPDNAGDYIVKRIVGVEGDTVSADGGALFINGEYASEPYIKEPMEFRFPPITVGPNSVFILGDNRNKSERWDKTLETRTIVGAVRLRYLPMDRFSKMHGYPLVNSQGS